MEGVFTSESVGEGHPDKVADQIADAVLDACLEQDSESRVACDVLVKSNTVVVAGEITTKARIDVEYVVRKVIRDIGYVGLDVGFDANTCQIIQILSTQSSDIAHAIDHEDQGAGDQGTVFGFACDETDALMPAPILYAHMLVKKQAELRKKGQIPWLLPDGKSQVTFRYLEGKPVEVAAIVLSTQHKVEVTSKILEEAVMEEIIKPVFKSEWLTKNTRYLINPSGRFVLGGPASDCGLTGRKTAVDAYGGHARDGGGCFSGKDPSKVDRSGAYAARFIAKNIVAAGLARVCEIQIAYVIGLSSPVSLFVDTFGTGKMENDQLLHWIQERFDLRPHAIINMFNLKAPIYLKTATYGHFGRLEFPWEQVLPDYFHH